METLYRHLKRHHEYNIVQDISREVKLCEISLSRMSGGNEENGRAWIHKVESHMVVMIEKDTSVVKGYGSRRMGH